MGAAVAEISENISNIEDQNKKIMKHLRIGEKQRKDNHKEMLCVLKEIKKDESTKDDQNFIKGQVQVMFFILMKDQIVKTFSIFNKNFKTYPMWMLRIKNKDLFGRNPGILFISQNQGKACGIPGEYNGRGGR